MEETRLQKYYQARKSFPEEAKIFLESDLYEEIIESLAKKYSINGDDVADLVISFIAEKFSWNFLSQEITANSIFNKSDSKAFIRDFLGMIFLPIAAYFKQSDLESTVKKSGLKNNDYEVWIRKLNLVLSEEVDSAWNELDKNLEKINWKEETIEALEFLNANLSEILTANDLSSSAYVNQMVLILLLNDPRFKDQLLAALLDSQAILTPHPFILDNKPALASIGNWIKNYIYEYGGEKYDTLSFSRFISLSQNCKILNEAEKSAVIKLIHLFFSVKFFPQSMGDMPMEDWQLFPVEQIDKLRKDFGKILDKQLSDLNQEQAGFSAVVEKKSEAKMSSVVPKAEELKQKLSRVDWQNIQGLERRALLEELGVSPAEFKNWHDKNYLK